MADNHASFESDTLKAPAVFAKANIPGSNGVHGVTNNTSDSAVFGENNGGGVGVFGLGGTSGGAGIVGESRSSDPGLFASSTSGNGVHGVTSSANSAVFGENTGSAIGVFGRGGTAGGAGVFGESRSSDPGIFGTSASGEGVHGESSSTAPAVVGVNTAASSPNGDGVFGACAFQEGSGNAIHGRGGNNAGFFEGDVTVKAFGISAGDITADGSISAAMKPFVIDHPCDPENKFLYHCSVESPDMLNVYSGNATSDASGEAHVALPDYFDALNRDFRYQLTPIGQFCQAIIAEEIANNRFMIKTDKPNVKVSWQVSGVRKDAYVKAYPIVVEKEKSAAEKGFYLHPRLFGQPADKALLRSPKTTNCCAPPMAQLRQDNPNGALR